MPRRNFLSLRTCFYYYSFIQIHSKGQKARIISNHRRRRLRVVFEKKKKKKKKKERERIGNSKNLTSIATIKTIIIIIKRTDQLHA